MASVKGQVNAGTLGDEELIAKMKVHASRLGLSCHAGALHYSALLVNINPPSTKTTSLLESYLSNGVAMNESNTAEPADALIALLRSSLSASGEQAFGHLVLYTTFGVVRGRIGLTFAQGLIGKETAAADAVAPNEAIEINDVTVEHYSNHLANASFDRLYVRLSDVLGFALVGSQGQDR